MPIEIIKRTQVGDFVIITAKRADPHLLRPFATFAVVGESRYARHITDTVSEAAAMMVHNGYVAQIEAAGKSDHIDATYGRAK